MNVRTTLNIGLLTRTRAYHLNKQTYIHTRGPNEKFEKLWLENTMEGYCFEGKGLNRRTILKRVLKKHI